MLTQALEGLPGIYLIADDVLITGEGDTQETAHSDHDVKLRQFLSRCREKNIKLNSEKFRLRQQEVPYIGHLLTADGLKIDPEKIRAVRDMPRPTDVKGVQRLMGMVNYLSKFYKHLSDDCDILRQLTHKDNMWEWTEMHDNAFSRLKDNIAKAPVLKYYNPQEELTLQRDASETGLGAALTQEGKPVAFGSRALTPTARGYAQIEKECFAIVYGMEKFHQYTYGRKVRVQSDHKPLEVIVRKPLLSAPKRLQRMLLRLQRYNFDVIYVPGLDMLLADTLSRAYLSECSSTGTVEAEIETVNMVAYLPISEERLNTIRSATQTDKTLLALRDIVHYYSFQEELSVQDGIIFRGETLHPHEVEGGPWAKVGTDLFTFDSKNYLITVDYNSNFWEVDYLPDTKSSTVIRKVKAHFARQGVPYRLFSRQWPTVHVPRVSPFQPAVGVRAQNLVSRIPAEQREGRVCSESGENADAEGSGSETRPLPGYVRSPQHTYSRPEYKPSAETAKQENQNPTSNTGQSS